jgi:hypothetical protein
VSGGAGPSLYVENGQNIKLYNRNGAIRHNFGSTTTPVFDLTKGIVVVWGYGGVPDNILIDPRRTPSESFKRNGPFTYKIEEDASQNAFLRIYRHDGTLAKQYPPQ